MSDQQPGPGWWLASDGRWYPPELAPRTEHGEVPSAPAGPVTGADPPPASPEPPGRPAPVAVATPQEPPPRIGRLLALVAGLLLVGGAAAAAGYLLTDDDSGSSPSTTEAPATTSPDDTTTTVAAPTSTLPPDVAIATDPASGATIGTPDGWTAFVLTGRLIEDVRGEITATLGESFPRLAAILRQAEASVSRGEAMLIANSGAPEAVGTAIVVTPLSSEHDPTDPAVETAWRGEIEGANALDIRSERIELPAGPALRFDYRTPVPVGENTVDIVGRRYIIESGGANWMITMNTDDPNRDGPAFDTMIETFSAE